mmetsp:Transcript_12548/g.23156  ORF Transcript_12548/g.23156 Transcript_12548/m.23156 type:complete len:253 (+) Transcript_12548:70-828(+)
MSTPGDLDQPLNTKVDLSKEKPSTVGLENAAAAAVSKAAERAAQDPQVQAAVAQAASNAASSAASAAWQGTQARVVRGASEALRYVQMGGTGISMLCTIAALLTTFIAAFSVFGLLGFLIKIEPATYILNLYMFIFGIVALLLEADLERMAQQPLLGKLEPCVRRWQQYVHQEMHIITGLRGRGFFYLFLGVLGVVQAFPSLTFVCGLLNIFSGTMCVSASCTQPVQPSADGAGIATQAQAAPEAQHPAQEV